MKAILLALLLVVPLAGCADVTQQGSLVLIITLHQLRPDGGIDEWPHCSTAHESAREIVVEGSGLDPAAKRHPILLVVPRIDREARWPSAGSGSFAMGLHRAAAVPDGFDDTTEPLVTVTWAKGGDPVVDGTPRPLPSTWTVVDPAGRWHADLELRAGPDQVRWASSRGTCL